MLRKPIALALLTLPTAGRAADPKSQSLGWRSDASGRYPDAEPPTSWSIEKNLKWRASVGTSNSSPIVVGDKILLMAEPDMLLCLDRATGRLLWQQSSRFADLPPAAQPAKAPHYETSCGDTTPTPAGGFVVRCF